MLKELLVQRACIYMLNYLHIKSIEMQLQKLYLYSTCIIWDSVYNTWQIISPWSQTDQILLYIKHNLKTGQRYMHIIYLQYNQGILHGQFVWRQTLRFPNQLFTLCAEESAAVKMLHPKGFRPSVHKVPSDIFRCLGQVSDKRRGQQSSFREFL